jgi:2-polyprenyl-6-methoxyphenol hydroxylase-like FAD-dependent oxidoreductase
MRVVVAGGSLAGTVTSLLLARSGHDVVMLDRDRIEPAADVEVASDSAFRATAPQIVQPHGVLPRCRELLMQWLPDVYADMLAAGVSEATLPTQMPPTLEDRTERPGDERLALLLGRRSTVDWVLRRAAFAEPRVSVRSGVQVTGLLASRGQPPRVTGVHTADGPIVADLVVDATGRRSPIDRWLAAIDARPTISRRDECGLAYYSRHYRVVDPDARGTASTTRIIVAADEFTAGIWGGDNGWMVMAVAPLVEDKRFRNLNNPEVHADVLRTVPVFAGWLDKVQPISDIYAMGGLHNTLRRAVFGGAPVALGVHGVGDSVCTTNPTFGRGLSLAMLGAVDLVQALDAHSESLATLALELDRCIDEHIEPFYADQAANDARRLAEMRYAIFGTPLPDRADDPDRVTFADLRQAAAHDATALRAFWQVMGMLAPPEEIYTDPQVVSATRGVLAAVRIDRALSA